MTYTIEDGNKAIYNNSSLDGGHSFTFECEPDDIDTAYDALAENLELVDNDGNPFPTNDYDDPSSQASKTLIDFQNVKDDDVETMLKDMQKMGFIDSWEVED